MRVRRVGPLLVSALLIGAVLPDGAAAGTALAAIPAMPVLATPDLSIPPLLASVGPTGGNGTPNVIWMGSSADASHVVFRTFESLTSDDTNTRLDLYEWSEAHGVRLITPGSTSQPNYEGLLISPDGEHIFVFTPDPLLPEDTDADPDIYEWSNGQLTLASTSPTETGSNFNYPLGVTPDGATLYFYASGSLTPDDTDDKVDIYKRTGGVVSLISISATAGNGPNHVSFNAMSADGSHVFFQTEEQLDPADTDSVVDVYQWSAAGVSLVSTGPADSGSDYGSYQASTADGTHVYFATEGRLTADDTDFNADSYERFQGVTRLVSKGAAGEEAGNYTRVQSASADGSRQVIDVAGRLTSDDTDNANDLYLVGDGTATLLATGPTAASDDGLEGTLLGMTPDASRIFFWTKAALVATDTDSSNDIYMHTSTGTELVSKAPGNPNYGIDALWYGMSTDGRRVFFQTGEPIDSNDVNNDYDIAIWDEGEITRLPLPSGGDHLEEYNGSSPDGTRLFLRLGATMHLAPGDTDSARDIYQFTIPFVSQITFTPAPDTPASVAKFGRFEQQFQLNRTYGTEANDPSVIEVTGRFVSPTGATFTVPAYWGLDYAVEPGTGVGSSENYVPLALDPPADGIWHVRFSPDEVGTWTFTLRAQDHVAGQETAGTSAQMTFDVTPSAAHGQVERDPRDDRFLRYEDGTPYYPMGHNVAFQQGEPENNDGEHYSEPLFASMEAAGQNWTRVWMTDFNRNALEWYSGHWAHWYTGVGHYADQSAFRIERQLEIADDHGLQVQLVLNDHGQMRGMVNSSEDHGRWDQNPYNAANGGPVPADRPEEFFTNPEAKELFKHRLRYLVARYSDYRNLLSWELFNEVQFVGSDDANPYNSAQVRDDIVTWHAEMAAYLRSIDPYHHMITTSSDIESSLKNIWADPNIDTVQVHDYDPALTTRDTRFRGYVTSLNAAYHKPVIIGEFGIAGDPEINFDPVARAPLNDRNAHLLEATHLHNAAWAAAMSGSGAMSWWWGAYIHSSPARHRAPPDFPANERVNPPLRDFFAGEDLAGMNLVDSAITAPASVVALGMDNGSRGFAWIRDAQNEYGTGAGPGDVAGRTMSGVRVNVGSFTDGTYRIEIHDPWGAQPTVELLATSVGGTLSIPLPDFTRDIALKIRPAGSATAVQPVTVTVTSPNGGPVDITETTTPASPPAGSGYTYLAFQLGITAPPASTATPLALVFTIDKALLDSVDPDLTADTVSVFRNDVPVPLCTTITTDPPATPDPCVNARETLTGADTGDVRITVLTSTPSRWNFGVGPARANQTISFGNLSNRTMLQTPFTVSATASSGLVVSFSTTTPAVCTSGGTNGRTITLVGAGSCTVKADQAGNAAFNPAPSVSRSFTVTRVSQSITFNALANRTMLQTPFTVSATASSGLPVTFTSTTPSVCTTSGAAGATVNLVAQGTCTINASQAGNATYAPALDRPRSFTVTRASQTITFTNPGNKTLVQSPLAVSATATSGLPVTFSTTTPAVCTSGGTRGATITLVTTGSCSVVASQAGNANYAPATSITRTFTVSKAAQTIAFGPLPTANLQQSPITVSATASSNLTVTFTTSSGAICTAGGPNGTKITLLKAGTCKVVASQAGDAIYKAAPNVTQSFTVTTAKLAQTITFAQPADRSIGDVPLALSATASSGLAVSYAVAPASANVCSVSGSVLTLIETGTCTVTASQSGNNVYNAAPPVTRSLTATLAGFVQASGTSLVLDGQPFQIFGAAIYQTSNHGHVADPDQIFAWAHDAHLNTIRLTDIFLQTTNDSGAPYSEEDWQWIDGLIARARNEGLKVILDLSSYRNWLVWSAEIDHGWVDNCGPNQDRTPVNYPALDPYTVAHRADWTAFMNFVANRVNTVSGVTYRNDSTILVVSIAGEPIGPGYGECGRATTKQELTDFFEWSLAEWKSHDPHHLRSTGGLQGTYAGLDGNGNPIESGQQVDGIAIFQLADNTLPSLHTYPPRTDHLPLADGQTPVLAPIAQDAGKPWFTEEFGFMQDDPDEYRASEFDFVYDEQVSYGSVGSLFWNLGPEVGLGTFDVNPSTPLTWARVLAEAP